MSNESSIDTRPTRSVALSEITSVDNGEGVLTFPAPDTWTYTADGAESTALDILMPVPVREEFQMSDAVIVVDDITARVFTLEIIASDGATIVRTIISQSLDNTSRSYAEEQAAAADTNDTEALAVHDKWYGRGATWRLRTDGAITAGKFVKLFIYLSRRHA